MIRLITVILLLIQSSTSTAQAKYLIIEIKNHNIELYMNITPLISSNFNDSLRDVNFNCYQTVDSSLFYTCEFFTPDSILALSSEEFQKLYYSKGYNKPDTTICESGCSSFRFYSEDCQLINDYKFYNKSDVVSFLKQLIINCEEKMNSDKFKKLFLYYIEINE